MSKFDKLYNLILQQLTSGQKVEADQFAAKRKKTLSFGPMFKKQRTYFPLQTKQLPVLETPKEFLQILDKTDYYCPDFRSKYVFRKSDKLKQKPVKLMNVIQKELKDNPTKLKELKKKFDQRLSTSRTENITCMICITHNPYDVAGMSTDRNWTSCMNLYGGAYKQTALKQVQYGGMCAYLIKEDDKEIKQPIARIAIKRLVGELKTKAFIFQAQPAIYGDKEYAKELKFDTQVDQILEQSNKQTLNNQVFFRRKDGGSYSDSGIDVVAKTDNLSQKQLNKLAEDLTKHPTKINKIQWNEIAQRPNLSEAFIKKFWQYLPHRKIIYTQKLSPEFMDQILSKNSNIDLTNLIHVQQVPETLLKKYFKQTLDKMECSYLLESIVRTQKISQKTLEEFIKIAEEKFEYFNKRKTPSVINSYMQYNPTEIDQAFIDKYQQYIKWDELSGQMDLTEDFIDKFSKYIDFKQLNKFIYTNFSEDFIQKYAEKLNWNHISTNSKLSEKFIQKYSDKVHWPSILTLQKGLSPEFKEKHKDKLKMYND